MNNFNFYNPVKILFGKGKMAELSTLLNKNHKILMLYGKGSIKKNGVYDQVMAALKGYNYLEFSGIEANPKYETLIKAIDLIKKEKIDFLLPVGGGSVFDGTKFIAAGVYYNGDPWDIVSKPVTLEKAMPLGGVLTLPATGSEMNGNSVISREGTQEKLSFGSPLVMPVFSILDPEVTYSLPKEQIANGVVDAFVHVTEQYLTYPNNAAVQDRMAESILSVLIEEGPKAMNSKTPNYDNRANIMWAATCALNGFIGVGGMGCWATHVIGHELTAYHGLDHAVTLAIIWPGIYTYLKNARKEKLLQYASRVWNINSGSSDERVELAIKKTDDFFRIMGIKTRLSEYNIGEGTINKIVERFKGRGMTQIAEQPDLQLSDLSALLRLRL